MKNYLLFGNYLGAEGNKGLLTEGGSSRKQSIETLATSLGGNLSSIYFSFGEFDICAFLEIEDDAAAAALSLAARSTGLVNVRTVPLLSPEVIDNASKKMPNYRGPGA